MKRPAFLGRRERRWRSGVATGARRQPLSLLVCFVLASATIITLDLHGGRHSPLEPVRLGVGQAIGPVEAATAAAIRPLTEIPGWFTTQRELRDDVAALRAANSRLRRKAATAEYNQNRLREYNRLTSTARRSHVALVPAHVIGIGPAQSFRRTVTIDAGAASGITADMTVVNGDGLVGRVLRVSDTTATVLLIVDAHSVVGGRLGRTMEMGFLTGRGDLQDAGRLDFELVDDSVVPARNDPVVTWGSKGGAPYVAGIPVGRVVEVYNSPRQTSRLAVIEPYVDFTSLDTVGVVVPSGTRSDRGVIEADGSIR